MSILRGLMGAASEVDMRSLRKEFEPILIDGESIEKAFQIIRELIVFTNKRLVLVDKQGVTGKKAEYMSIPYRSILRFSKGRRGRMELDSEIKLWVLGMDEPVVREFKSDEDTNAVYKLLSQFILNVS